MKIVVVGNCQSRPIATIIKQIAPSTEIIGVVVVHLATDKEKSENLALYASADIIIAQLVADNYPCDYVRTKFLLEKFNGKIVVINNLFFKGYNPDWSYKRLNGGGLLKGPMGDYHNDGIFSSWAAGTSIQDTKELLYSDLYLKKYNHVALESLNELRLREQLSDISIVDFINEKMKQQRLFWSFNHPSNSLLELYTKKILDFIGVSIELKLENKNESLGKFRPRVIAGFYNVSDAEQQGVSIDMSDSKIELGPIKKYTDYELIEVFFEVYNKNSQYL